jgi:molybdate transport system ATP-binding protein
MLSVELSHRFGAFTLDVAFEAPGGVTVLFGKSGSGKTSVIKSVAGLLEPDQGRIATAPTRSSSTAPPAIFVPPHKRRMGYVFQEARLFPHLDVRRNLTYGRRFAPRGPGRGRGRRSSTGSSTCWACRGCSTGVRGTCRAARRSASPSAGRSCRDPALLLADEPLAALDADRKEEILPYFERLRDDLQVPILYVTHSAPEVARLATTVVVLEDGRVIAQRPRAEVLGDPDITPLGPTGRGCASGGAGGAPSRGRPDRTRRRRSRVCSCRGSASGRRRGEASGSPRRT